MVYELDEILKFISLRESAVQLDGYWTSDQG